jgi:hypothetical protein
MEKFLGIGFRNVTNPIAEISTNSSIFKDFKMGSISGPVENTAEIVLIYYTTFSDYL